MQQPVPPSPELLDQQWLGNPVLAWLAAAGATTAAFLLLATARWLLGKRAGGYLAKRNGSFQAFAGRMLQRASWVLVIVLSVWFGARFLDLTDGIERVLRIALVLAAAFQAISWAMEALDYAIAALLRHRREQRGSDDIGLVSAAPAIRFLGRLVVVALIVLLALQNLGIDITAMIAGLGIGGIAIALAVQNILGDLFASLSIVLDRPFVVGDFIVVGDRSGTVELIGLKTTRLRSLSGEQLIFANSDLLGSRIQNFKRMRERRVVLQFGVPFETPIETVARIPAVVRECIEESRPKVRFERSHFASIGDSSFRFEAVYWLLDPDYNPFMDVQQSINLDVCRRLQALGVAFAYPTRTLHLGRGTPPTAGAPA
jgi:small-conductance mechanosensitive channel